MKLRMIIAGWMALVATTCFAQKEIQTVENAFNKTVSSLLKEDFVTWSEINNDKDAQYFLYEFSIPESKQKIIESLNKAIVKSMPKALTSIVKKSGTNDDKTLVMDNGNGFRKEYDGHNCNCYAVKFRNGPSYTRNYSLSWYSPKDGKIKGVIVKGNIMINKKNGTKYPTQRTEADNQSPVIISNIKVPNQTEIDKVLEENKRLKKEKEDKQAMYYQYEPQYLEQFLAQFNNYCNIFKNTDKFLKEAKNNGKSLEKTTFQNVIANRLMKLCTHHIQRAPKDTRDYYSKSIQELKKYTNDEGVKFILDQTIQTINQK